jgi:glutamyl-tRNA synthetase
MGYLPEAMLNYLARLGWSHGDDELFSREQMVQWFDGSHMNKSPAMWDAAKLAWVNGQYVKQASDERLAALVAEQLGARGMHAEAATCIAAAALYKDRCTTVVELADWVAMMLRPVAPKPEDVQELLTDPVRAALRSLRDVLANEAALAWDKAGIAAAIKQVLADHQLKMPQLAPALRVMVCGRRDTPSIDAVLSLFTRGEVLARLQGV